MKKFIITLILGTMLIATLASQENFSFEYKGVVYQYNELPTTTWEQIGDNYTILEVVEGDDTSIVVIDGKIYVVENE